MMNQDCDAERKAYADTDCEHLEMAAHIQEIVSKAKKKGANSPFNELITRKHSINVNIQ